MAGQSLVYTLDEALSTIGFGKYQGFLLVYAGLGWIGEAMGMMLLSYVGPAVQADWGLSSAEESMLSTVVFTGMLVGGYLWGFVSDTYGRKKGFLCAVTVTAGAGLLSAFSPNYLTLMILRCLVGLGLGGLHVFTSWFLEFVPTQNRGTWLVIFSSFWTVGIIFEAALAWIVMSRLSWRWLLALSSLPSLTVVFFSSLTPESPRYLCTKGQTNEAYDILEKAAVFNQTELPPGMLIPDQVMNMNDECPLSEDTHLLSSTEKESHDSEEGHSSLSIIFSKKLIRTTLLLWVLYFGNTFSYYGIILLTSELSSGESKCMSMKNLHADNIKDANLYTNVFITSFAELPGFVFSALILDRIGRKRSMALMLLLGFILLLPLVTQQDKVWTTGLLFGARMFISATFTIACIYAPEVYPTSIRASGVGIASAIGRLGGMICPLVAVGLVSDCRQTAAVILFGTGIAISLLTVLCFPFETKGRNLDDALLVSSQQ